MSSVDWVTAPTGPPRRYRGSLWRQYRAETGLLLTRRRNLKNAGCHAAGKSQLHRVIGGPNIQNLDIRTSQ